ncbi:PEGA domain-containing protein [Candidatus Saccharibacteria bacterium]|nr:PEGA domain-containing protein [Candidatus Saccharibacteria bacterium]
MDYDKRERLRSRRVIISEALMVIAVIAIVIVLAFIVSGYWVNSDFTVERQGMLQISSVPTGASLVVDGETSWLSQTNTSKILKSGEHNIILTKEGYDTWSRDIRIRDGLLYRIRYPRLFLKERTATNVLDTKGATFASISPDHSLLLLANNTTRWQVVKLADEKLKPTEIDVAPYFAGVSEDGVFTGQIRLAVWDTNNEHMLMEVVTDKKNTWTLLDVKNPKDSLKLSEITSLSFDQMSILDDSANTLVGLSDGALYSIDVSGRKVSGALAKHVDYYDHYNNQIIYSSLASEVLKEKDGNVNGEKNETGEVADSVNGAEKSADSVDENTTESAGRYALAIKTVNDEKSKVLKYMDEPARAAMFDFYDAKYLAVLAGAKVTVYNVEDLSREAIYEDASYTLSFVPDSLKVGESGEYLAFSAGNRIAALDMEAETVTEWTTDGGNYGWLTGGMVYSVASEGLTVYDFDGLNRRVLRSGALQDRPVTITDDKWHYYFQDDALVREVVRK